MSTLPRRQHFAPSIFEPDSLTPEEIIRRMKEIEAAADVLLPFEEACVWCAYYLELEHELERISDPHQTQTRH